MIGILTVTGLDHTGIVAAVSTLLAKNEVNIVNISQTLMGEYFTMIMQITFDMPIQELQAALEEVAKEQALSIRVQSEAIFQAMHEV